MLLCFRLRFLRVGLMEVVSFRPIWFVNRRFGRASRRGIVVCKSVVRESFVSICGFLCHKIFLCSRLCHLLMIHIAICNV